MRFWQCQGKIYKDKTKKGDRTLFCSDFSSYYVRNIKKIKKNVYINMGWMWCKASGWLVDWLLLTITIITLLYIVHKNEPTKKKHQI